MDWQFQFAPQIVARGQAYYQQNLVTNFAQQGAQFTATVTGTEAYQVSLTIHNGRIVAAECDCPYAADGHYCKHMAAVMFMAEDLIKTDTDEETPLNEPADESSIERLVDQATNDQLRDFLKSVLANNGHLAQLFQLIVQPDSTTFNSQYYQQKIDGIVDGALGYGGFIDYDAATDFEDEISTFIYDDLQPVLDHQQLAVAFEIVSHLETRLALIDIDDSDGEMMIIAQECTEIWQQILAGADKKLQKRLFKWFATHLDETMGPFEDDLTQLFFDNFSTPTFLQQKLTVTSDKFKYYHNQEDYEWKTDQWIQWHLQVMAQVPCSPMEITAFCEANLNYTPVRKYYADYCVQQGRYDQAIKLLIDGKRTAALSGIRAGFSEQLKDVYRKLGRQNEYQHELWQLLTEYQPADLDLYREFKAHYRGDDWPTELQRLLAAMPAQADLRPLYAEAHLYRQLLAAVVAEPGLFGVQQYEALLKPKFSAELLRKYAQTVKTMAEQTGTRRQYQKLVMILKQMQQYPDGMAVTKAIVHDWRQQYPRRSAMLDELDKFERFH